MEAVLDHPTGGTIERLKATLDAGAATRARLGLVVLQSDQTIEHEFVRLLPRDGVVLHHARIPNAMEVTPETLARMELELPAVVALLAPDFGFDAIAYACTSGATTIGEERVAEIVHAHHPHAKVSDPISAAKAALAALGASRIALVTPYSARVTGAMRDNFLAAGFETRAIASFDEHDDRTVARIAPASILEAVLKVGARKDCEAVFVSCTSLRVLPIIAEAEARLEKPVLSSNQALAWHLMRLAGLDDTRTDAGRLFAIA